MRFDKESLARIRNLFNFDLTVGGKISRESGLIKRIFLRLLTKTFSLCETGDEDSERNPFAPTTTTNSREEESRRNPHKWRLVIIIRFQFLLFLTSMRLNFKLVISDIADEKETSDATLPVSSSFSLLLCSR